MKKTSLVFVAALALAIVGCKKSGDGDCDKAIAHSMELSKATMSKMPGMDDKLLGKLRDIGIKSCKDDAWAEDALKCMTDAKSEGDAQGCYAKLTPDQQTKMNKAAMDAMTPPAAGSAAAGSAAAGSAAAGSAGSGSGS